MKLGVKLLLTISMAAILTSCATKPSQAPGEPGAQAYGLGEKGALEGTEAGGALAGQRYVNELKAPSHQVYYFSFDQSRVNRQDYRAIAVQAGYLVSHPNAKIRLEGNADDRGSREYNVALGWRRAQAIAHILKQQGVSVGQMELVSYGKEHPAVVGETEEARSLNRRVELVYESVG